MHIVIIGGSHAGIACAITLKEKSPSTIVTIIEKQYVLGFIANSINTLVLKKNADEEIKNFSTFTSDDLKMFGINLLLGSEVYEVNNKEQVVNVISNNVKASIPYDRLVLAMGSENLEIIHNIDADVNVTNMKYKENVLKSVDIMQNSSNILIIGAGLIGVELASSISKLKDKNVYIIERLNRILYRYFDIEITKTLEEISPKNVFYFKSEGFYRVFNDQNKTYAKLSNKTLEVDSIFLGLNTYPNSKLVEYIVDIDFDKTIIVNEHMQTSDPNIYATGDLVKIPLNGLDEPGYLPLIKNSRLTGIIAANNILNNNQSSIPNTIRTIDATLFGHFLGSAGVTESEANFYNINYKVTNEKLFEIATDTEIFVQIKLVFSMEESCLIGVQLISNDSKAIDLMYLLAAEIEKKSSINTLIQSDIIVSDLTINKLLLKKLLM